MNVGKFTIVCLLSLLCACLEAQELRVKGLYEAPHDLSARTQARKDINGDYCALLKVQLVDRGAEFGGIVIGDVSFERKKKASDYLLLADRWEELLGDSDEEFSLTQNV